MNFTLLLIGSIVDRDSYCNIDDTEVCRLINVCSYGRLNPLVYYVVDQIMSFLFSLYMLQIWINPEIILSDIGFYYLNNDNKGNLLCNDVFYKFFE